MLSILLGLNVVYGFGGEENQGVEHGIRYDRVVIRNVMVIDGKGTPMRGPQDVIVEKNRIASVSGADRRPDAYSGEAHMLDGTGMVLMPGLINAHVHIHTQRGGMALPLEYSYKLWLACGQTTVRDVGSDTAVTLEERRKSAAGEIVAPRLLIYMVASGKTPEEIRKSVQEIKKKGGDGVKIFGLDRDLMRACLEESQKLGLMVAHHCGVEETDAWDDAAFGVSTIEHWYGIPDAALKGSQNFPPDYNYNNESDRFRWAGRLWREADPLKLDEVLSVLASRGVAWIPTFVIYEACRDMQRAANQPWFRDYLHPALENYFRPNPRNHGSFAWNWSTEDEIRWKENYLLWMHAVRDFAEKGGTVGVGDDAGFIYEMYGFSLIRELELLQEAGFHPIDVVKAVTCDNARILGLQEKLGRIRAGFQADLVLLNENPLANFKYLYPTGVVDVRDGKTIRRGGIQWTIKDGYFYHAPTLMEEVKTIVDNARNRNAVEK